MFLRKIISLSYNHYFDFTNEIYLHIIAFTSKFAYVSLHTLVLLHKLLLSIFMVVLVCSSLQKKAVSPSIYFPHGLKAVPYL